MWDLLRTTFSADTYAGKGDRVLHRDRVLFMLADEIPQLISGKRWHADAERLWMLASEDRDPPWRPPDLDEDAAPLAGPVSTIVFEIDWSRLEQL